MQDPRQHRRYSEAQVLQVISAAPERITPNCTHYGIVVAVACNIWKYPIKFNSNNKLVKQLSILVM